MNDGRSSGGRPVSRPKAHRIRLRTKLVSAAVLATGAGLLAALLVAGASGAGGQTTLAGPASAGDTNIKVASVSSMVVGGTLTVDPAGTSETVTVAAVGTAASTATTLPAGASAGATNIKVASVAGMTCCHKISIDTGANNEIGTIASVGTAATPTTLAAPSNVGDTNIKVASVAGMTVGHQISIDTGANNEVGTISTVGTAGPGGTGITLTAALTIAHASFAAVQDLGTGITLTAALTLAHASGAAVQDLGTGVTFIPALAGAHAFGVTVNVNNPISGPVTTASYLPATVNGWFPQNPTVTLNVVDNSGLGIASTNYRIDGASWQTYTAPFAMTGEGTHTLDYYSVDNSSNTEATHSETVEIDTVPPVVTNTLGPATPNGSNGWYVSNVHATVSASDTVGSGVAETRCVLDPATPPASFDAIAAGCAYAGAGANVTANGLHTLYAASEDNAGNKESPLSSSFKIDRTAPGVSCASADGAWHSTNVSLACTASDLTSGLANAADSSFSLATSVAAGAETANASTGNHQVCDMAGNCATAGPVSGNKIDRKPPTIAITSPTGTGTAGHPAVLHSLFLAVGFSATDGGSGFGTWTLRRHVAAVTARGGCGSAVSIDRTVTASTGGSSLTDVETLQRGKCYFWTLDARDAVGNTSVTVTSEVIAAA
jgi:hypothetical protein